MKNRQNIWLWALTAAVVLLAAALAGTQGRLAELRTAYSALQQEAGELRLDLKSTQNRLQEQEEALEQAAAQTTPQPEEPLLERYELTPLRLDAAAHQVELGVSLALATPDQSAEATLNVYQGSAERKRLARVELTRDGDGTFSGQAAVPADSTSLQILVTVRTGGDTATERLYEGRATGLLPVALSSRSGEAARQDGEARITAAVQLRERAAAASEQAFRLYRNGQLEETIPAASGQESGAWEGTGTISCAAGDQLEVRFFCVDGLGLGYEFPVRTWTVKEDRLAPGWPVTNTPALVWP